MLIQVWESAIEPNGSEDPDSTAQRGSREVWRADVDEITATTFHTMNADLDVGQWYEFDDFKRRLEAIELPQEAANIGTSVGAEQFGVDRLWKAMIEVSASSVILMMCRSMIQYFEQLPAQRLWVRVE